MMPAPDSDTPLPPDTLIGPWRLLECVGGGTYGRVYKAVLARQPDSTPYALKLSRRIDEPRFGREAEFLSRLHHPGVPRLHASSVYVDARGRAFPFLVMQFIPGTNLYDWVHERKLSARQVLELLAQVARALEATHHHGLHRDVKGDNVLVRDDGHVMLVDFGACWLPDARSLTDTVVPPGTEPYRSPQILRFRDRHWGEVGVHYRFQPEDDLYAFGVMVFYLLTGVYPSSVSDLERIEALLHPSLARLLRRLLSEEPSLRGTVRELAEATEQAAANLEPEADLPEVTRVTPAYEEPPFPRGPPLHHPVRGPAWARAKWAVPVHALCMAVVVSGLFALLTTHLEPRLVQSATLREDRVKLGSAALSPASPESAGPEEKARAVKAKVPGAPLPGQRRPPCEQGVTEINKGCWVPALTLQLPCPPGSYEWKERCYTPLIAPEERLPTSEDP